MNKPFKVKIRLLSFYPFLKGKGREFTVIRNKKIPSYLELVDVPPYLVRESDCEILEPNLKGEVNINSTFKNQQEIWEYLLVPGNKVTCENNLIYEMVEGTINCKIPGEKYKQINQDFQSYQNFYKYIEKLTWYENISEEGIWCKCWDNEEIHYSISLVISYNGYGREYPFETFKVFYANAKPLSQELQIFLNKELGK